jgi:hypothetical protein
MPRAASVVQAAFHQFASYDRNIWENAADQLPAFDQVYVERPAPEGAGGRRLLAVAERMRDDLVRTQGATKVLLTGQRGSGKSMELRRLYESEAVRGRFECLKVILDERLNTASAIDIRYVLLALAAVLAEFVVVWQYDDLAGRGLGEGEFAPVVAWLEALQKLSRTPPPEEKSWTFKLNLYLGDVTRQLKTDDPIRSAVLQDPTFAPSRLENLVSALVRLIEKATGRDLLLIVDDGDKIIQEASARGVFVDNLPTLLSVECSMVVTFPYWLYFDDPFQKTVRLCPVYLLANVKVIHRPPAGEAVGAPQTLLPEARAFFGEVYDHLVEPDQRLLDDAALEQAALYSAGIVRELVRILQRGFRFAYEYGDGLLTAATLAEALLELEREMVRATQLETTRRRLMKVRLQKRLDDKEDWKLLDSLLLVELSNHRPWYDVHPILQSYVDGLIKEVRERLARGGLAGPALEERLLEDLRGA